MIAEGERSTASAKNERAGSVEERRRGMHAVPVHRSRAVILLFELAALGLDGPEFEEVDGEKELGEEAREEARSARISSASQSAHSSVSGRGMSVGGATWMFNGPNGWVPVVNL